MISHSPIDKIIFAGIVVLLIFAPLAFGSVHVWAYSVIQFGVLLLLSLWFVDRLIFSKAGTLIWVKTPINLLMIILIGFIFFQTIPLPASLLALLSPKTFADKTAAMSILTGAQDAGSIGVPWIPISYSIHPTLNELLKLISYFGMFFLVVNTLKSKKQIDILVYCLIFLGLFEALYAIYQVFTDTPRVWWWVSRVGPGRYASGTFIGSNHFAGYMQMAVCLTFGFLVAQEKKSARMISDLGGVRESVQRIVGWFSPESSRPKTLSLFFVGIVMAVSLVMSASRGGIVAISISMLLMSVLFLFKKRYRKHALLTILFCLLAFFYALHLGIDPTLKKFEHSDRGIAVKAGDNPIHVAHVKRLSCCRSRVGQFSLSVSAVCVGGI